MLRYTLTIRPIPHCRGAVSSNASSTIAMNTIWSVHGARCPPPDDLVSSSTAKYLFLKGLRDICLTSITCSECLGSECCLAIFWLNQRLRKTRKTQETDIGSLETGGLGNKSEIFRFIVDCMSIWEENKLLNLIGAQLYIHRVAQLHFSKVVNSIV